MQNKINKIYTENIRKTKTSLNFTQESILHIHTQLHATTHNHTHTLSATQQYVYVFVCVCVGKRELLWHKCKRTCTKRTLFSTNRERNICTASVYGSATDFLDWIYFDNKNK